MRSGSSPECGCHFLGRQFFYDSVIFLAVTGFVTAYLTARLQGAPLLQINELFWTHGFKLPTLNCISQSKKMNDHQQKYNTKSGYHR